MLPWVYDNKLRKFIKNGLRDLYIPSDNFMPMMGWTYNMNGDSLIYYPSELLQKHFHKTVTPKQKNENNIETRLREMWF